MNIQQDTSDALLQSRTIQAAASAQGFDWPDVSGVLEKVEEEVAEIRAALAAGELPHARKELGDLLLITVNLSRFLGADPRNELLDATERFSNRFEFLLRTLATEGKVIKNCSLEEIESCWQRVKHDADKLLSKRA